MGSMPSTEIVPDVGVRMPVIILIVVDLPAPFGPMKASRSPARTVKSMPHTAFTSRYSGFVSARMDAFRPGCFTRERYVFVKSLALTLSMVIPSRNSDFIPCGNDPVAIQKNEAG